MAAFGPVVGFLIGAYLLSFHMDSFTHIISIGKTKLPSFTNISPLFYHSSTRNVLILLIVS